LLAAKCRYTLRVSALGQDIVTKQPGTVADGDNFHIFRLDTLDNPIASAVDLAEFRRPKFRDRATHQGKPLQSPDSSRDSPNECVRCSRSIPSDI
jgi:hypothetical protein